IAASFRERYPYYQGCLGFAPTTPPAVGLSGQPLRERPVIGESHAPGALLCHLEKPGLVQGRITR
ncbi:MAG: hypothetical protein NT167_11215, partial [Verrucomicrobia bacterium]|nr:hypothetical protein [Verrucomicrobiota bacterium]